MKKAISYSLDRNILFDAIRPGENILILYQNTSNHQQIFRNFFGQAANEHSLFYLAHTSNKLCFDFTSRNHYFNVLTEDTIPKIKNQLDKCFQEMKEQNKELFLIADWSRANVGDCSIFLPFLHELIEKNKGTSPANWKRKYQEIKRKSHFLLINAFELSNLKEDFIRQLISLHSRVFLLQENLTTFQLPIISQAKEKIFPRFHVLPQERLEKLVKDNLVLISLLLLEKGNKSGYQLLKEIAQQFRCIPSQGTLYPLLYQLEKENKIQKINGKGREIFYSLSKETKEQLTQEKEICLKTYQHLACFLEGGGSNNNTDSGRGIR